MTTASQLYDDLIPHLRNALAIVDMLAALDAEAIVRKDTKNDALYCAASEINNAIEWLRECVEGESAKRNEAGVMPDAVSHPAGRNPESVDIRAFIFQSIECRGASTDTHY